eukprot:8969004-Ditylum_brightwellii.AAC.1
MYLSDPDNGSNRGEDNTNQNQDSAHRHATNNDEETKLEFNSTSHTTQHNTPTQPASNITSPNSSNEHVNDTTPHGNENDTNTRSEGMNTSPSSNATVNNAIIEETNSEQQAIEHNIREPGGKKTPRTQAVPMQP